jgi:hypothetical protein
MQQVSTPVRGMKKRNSNLIDLGSFATSPDNEFSHSLDSVFPVKRGPGCGPLLAPVMCSQLVFVL